MRPRAGIAPGLVLLALGGCGQGGDPADTAAPSVAVSVAPVGQGALPETVVAYGTVGPAMAGARTISLAQPGQIAHIMVTPGLAVRAGQPLMVFEPAASARAAFAQARHALRAAQVAQDSTAQLLSQQLATADQMAQARRALDDARASLRALGEEGAGRARIVITAPFAGVVTAIPVAQGDRPAPGSPLLTLANAGGLVVNAGVDPADRARLVSGQRVRLTRLSGGAPVDGRVIRVGAALNARTRLVDVDMAFAAGALIPGEAVKAQIATRPVPGWIVPHRAVVTANGPAHVFQDQGGKARQVPVTVLLAGEESDVVAGALDRARPVILDGAYQVNDGDRLRRGP